MTSSKETPTVPNVTSSKEAPLFARAVTSNGNDQFAMKDKATGKWSGICFDLWRKVASDLNIDYNLTQVDSWFDTFKMIENDEADVIVQLADFTQISPEQLRR